jgi:aryl-phospho-beta-D-glucosidase BglC (GH1 family)
MLKPPLLLFALTLSMQAADLPEPSHAKLPRWRGFNLLEKFFFSGQQKPFHEDDFRMISELGFNFVRLPMDYRGYIAGKDWEKFDEKPLKHIDQAIEWGGKYGVHVCLNLHRAPGWTVAKPPEKTDLWNDPEPRRVAALHWRMFAKRYRGIPNSRLSFNLFNEPAGIEEQKYVSVVETMLEAIRAEHPDRLVLCDGAEWGRQPVDAFIPMKVGMMTRGYSPFRITHYKATWVGDNRDWPVPAWPMAAGTNGTLLGPAKPEGSHPLPVEGPIAAGSTLKIIVGTVSWRATLAVNADAREIAREEFIADPADKRWDKVELMKQWETHRAEGAVELQVEITEAARKLELRTIAGDWLSLKSLTIVAPGGAEAAVNLENNWAQPPEAMIYLPEHRAGPVLGLPRGRDWLRKDTVDPWLPFQQNGGGVMVGEWGAYKHTPHDVTLRWAEDCLKNWQEAGWGWALWNFRGDFGILDSGRSDVAYEDFQSHKLDRKFLGLLQRY